MNTRDALVAAATELLDSGGPDAVTLREVGRRAGVSHNAPYKHFAGKEALLAAVAARELAELTATTRSGTLEATLLGYVSWACAHPRRFALVFGPWTTGSPELAERAEEAWTLIVAAVTAAQRTGDLPPGPPERLAALIRSTTHGAIALSLTGHLSASGKGGVNPAALVHDLLRHLRGTVWAVCHPPRATFAARKRFR